MDHGDGGPGDIIAIIILSIITIGMVPDGITGTAGIRNTIGTFITVMVMDTVGIMVIAGMMPGVGPGGVDIMAGTCGTMATAPESAGRSLQISRFVEESPGSCGRGAR